MSLLEQLAQSEVPPPPAELDQRVHQKLNKSLVLLWILEFGLRGTLYALVHFVHAVVHFVIFSMTGRERETAPRRAEGEDPRPT